MNRFPIYSLKYRNILIFHNKISIGDVIIKNNIAVSKVISNLYIIGLLPFLLVTNDVMAASSLCNAGEKESFSCNIGSKVVSVCSPDSVNLVYRYGRKGFDEIELESSVHFSATSYSGGGEGRLTFKNGSYSYVVYSGIMSGEWQGDASRDKIEYAGIYVVKNDEEIANLKCTGYQDKNFIHYLPPYTMEEFEYFE